MLRFLKALLIVLSVTLAGCPFMLSEAPLGSRPVALDPKELNGVWAAYDRVDGSYQGSGESSEGNEMYVFFLRVDDPPHGGVRMLMVPHNWEHDALRYDVLLRQHNGVTFANFRLRQSPETRDPADQPATMMRPVRVVVVEKISRTEVRLRFLITDRAREWIKQGRLPGRMLDFDPLREGSYSAEEGAAELVLGQLTSEQLDAITTPEGLDWLFPSVYSDSDEKKEFILRRIYWPPPVP